MSSRVRLPAVGLGLMLVVGCDGPTMAPVTGVVTSNGKPVGEAYVQFCPVVEGGQLNGPAKPSTGGTDAEGKFILSAYKVYDGAVIGKHNVRISLDETNPVKCPRLKVLSVEVKPGDNHFEINMNE
jgi:hypothetical protein